MAQGKRPSHHGMTSGRESEVVNKGKRIDPTASAILLEIF